jgi:hypothetical protein
MVNARFFSCMVVVLSCTACSLPAPLPEVGVPEVVANASSSGWRFVVTQTYTGIVGEPYVVALYSSKDQSPWNWHYIDHESSRWRKAGLVVDTEAQCVHVERGNKRLATLFWATGEYYLRGRLQASYPHYTIAGEPSQQGSKVRLMPQNREEWVQRSGLTDMATPPSVDTKSTSLP